MIDSLNNFDHDNNNQLAIVYNAFYHGPKTMYEVDVETGIERANICRYVSTLRESDRIFVVGKRRCKVSGHYAFELSTNPELKPEDNQFKLF